MATSAQRNTGPPDRRRDSQPPAPPCMVKSLAAFGQLAKDVLYGNRMEGLYGTVGGSKFVISSSTAGGVMLTTTATSSASSPLAGQLLASYSSGGLLADVLLSSSGVAEATFSRSFTLPAPPPPRKPARLAVGGVVALPGLCEPAKMLPPKLTLDYTGDYLVLKTSATATARPLITATAVAGAGKIAVGGDAAFSSFSRRLTRWSAAAAVHHDTQHLGISLTGAAGAATVLYGVRLSPRVAVGLEAGGEVGQALAGWAAVGRGRENKVVAAGEGEGAGGGGGEGAAALPPPPTAAVAAPRSPLVVAPTFSVGASFRLPPLKSKDSDSSRSTSSSSSSSGGVLKVKLSSRGVVSLLYRDVLTTGPRLTLTAEVDGFNASKGPKLGMTLEV